MADVPTGANAGSIPEGVQENRCGYTLDTDDFSDDFPATCCCRPEWRETEYCIWHADVRDKPVSELQKDNTDHRERLDGAVLNTTEFEGFDGLSNSWLIRADLTCANLSGANMTEAYLPEADLTEADLNDADLTNANLSRANLSDAILPGADLTNTSLKNADLTNAYLNNCDLTNAILPEANLTDADLPMADLTYANLSEANLTNAYLAKANLTDAYLTDAELFGADLTDANLINAELPGVNLTNATLYNTDLTNAYLRGADLTDAYLRGGKFINAELPGADLSGAYIPMSDFTGSHMPRVNLTDAVLTNAEAKGAEFERAVLTRTDLFNTSLVGARFYAATFDDTRINRGTKFGDPYSEALDEVNEEDIGREDATPWDKAAWSHRHLEELARQNALPEKAREAFERRKDVRRDELWYENGWGSWLKWGHSKASSLVMRYGERPWRVVGFSLLLILISTFTYPIRGIRPGRGQDPITYVDVFNAGFPDALGILGKHLYFSTVTFTTLGYGDFQPVGWAQLLATVESFLGALLMALLVFVLGRRSTW